ncbi:FMN-dependent NADH-azoreductase [Nocardia cyriacigeorgica]|uniref:FMN dependent NADH:quinone oxidoreductase n=2 Tax=Nocardia cyriacigeorgica TaxID=135487 RepID=A0A6P1D7A8_9NOCA|nr:NAD(P)H-dependent oxidoreductase [Nocardia cyriacigeorgica]NEW42078.1 FMN-dependent NADH-azoreductase [Nocardia cyriacigeorgica]NEW44880.1 FMN-dependent NADH-azoreductase [Nocardia cyriacigeorgica]NEW53116.1 FMN-dependent NADH-azoreductase [Nocardia cyriacigeorgica]NEW57161.1 FMN-dependent NADH-azoreductase [Nocardia cyriacigeorgica]
MATLLHLDASARSQSISRELSAAFADVWRAGNPDGDYRYRDLAVDSVPFIDQGWTEICDLVLAEGDTDLERIGELARTPAQRAAWRIAGPLLDELLAADVVLIGTPMYNYSVPAALKAWIDQVAFPRMSLGQRRFVVATARGGAYSPGSPKAEFDHQERYLRDFFAGHFAVRDAVFVNAELANSRLDPALAHLRDKYEQSYDLALATVRELAGEY